MKKLLFLGACLVALASQPVMAQTVETPVVIVHTFLSGLKGHILISRGEGKNEEIVFKNTKTFEEAEAYQKVLARLYQEGYTLKGTFSNRGSASTTLIYEKRP